MNNNSVSPKSMNLVLKRIYFAIRKKVATRLVVRLPSIYVYTLLDTKRILNYFVSFSRGIFQINIFILKFYICEQPKLGCHRLRVISPRQ